MKITIPEFTLPGPRLWKWAVLPIAAVALALALTWGGGATAQQGSSFLEGFPVRAEAAGIDFSLIAIPLSGATCDTFVDDKKCLVAPGDPFPVLVILEKNAGFAYNDVTIALTYTGGLTRLDQPHECGAGPFPSTAEIIDETDPSQKVYVVECFGIGAPVLYVGLLAVVEFECPPFKSKETITIHYGLDNPFTTGLFLDTQLTNFSAGPIHATETSLLGLTYTETIIINCNNYYPWDVHGPGQAVDLDGIVDLPNDILGVIQHFCPLITMPCAKVD